METYELYRFPAGGDPEKIAFSRQRLEQERRRYEGELPFSDIRRRVSIHIMAAALTRFSAEVLELDIAGAVSGIERLIHYLPPDVFDAREGAHVAGCMDEGQILVREQESLLDTLLTTQHEMIHALSRATFRFVRANGYVYFQETHTGYHNVQNNTFLHLNEALTEMMNRLVVQEYWAQNMRFIDSDASHCIGVSHYQPMILLMRALLRRAANEFGIQPFAVLRYLLQGMLTGRMNRLRILTYAIGASQMKRIAALGGSIEEVLACARDLGFNSVAEQLTPTSS